MYMGAATRRRVTAILYQCLPLELSAGSQGREGLEGSTCSSTAKANDNNTVALGAHTQGPKHRVRDQDDGECRSI